jgi:3-phenylpropionate/cinnamic acid dioxygenase small subunit
MSAQPCPALAAGPELQHCVEQFYYREARLLDGRQYLQWLGLLSPQVRYRLPARFTPQAVPSPAAPEQIHAVDRELSGYDGGASPLRDETYAQLAQRAHRALKPNAWAENPPPRTRRFVGNVEIEALAGGGLAVLSNLQLFHSQRGRADCVFTGQRRDRLELTGAELRIAEREVVLDCDVVLGPSVALLF